MSVPRAHAAGSTAAVTTNSWGDLRRACSGLEGLDQASALQELRFGNEQRPFHRLHHVAAFSDVLGSGKHPQIGDDAADALCSVADLSEVGLDAPALAAAITWN